jgi:uncharacterized cupin superfamily protein
MSWIEVSPAALDGEGLAPYVAGEITNLFDWAENPAGSSAHLMAHRGRFLVDIVSIEANAVHQPSKPGDEIVVVLEGTLQLTDDSDGREQNFAAGDAVLIPAGWAGLYRVIPGDRPFRELAIVPHDYFDEAAAPPPSGLSPRRLDPPPTAGPHELHRGRYSVTAFTGGTSRHPIEAPSEMIVRIVSGTLTLLGDGRAAEFRRGAVLVLPEGLVGEAVTSDDYCALIARWLDYVCGKS